MLDLKDYIVFALSQFSLKKFDLEG